MITYRTSAVKGDFLEFIKANIAPTQELAFMYHSIHRDIEQPIYIRSTNPALLSVIKKQYPLIECEQPANYLENDWGYWGNNNLFDIKL